MFSSNPDLGIMGQAYMKLKSQSKQGSLADINDWSADLPRPDSPSTLETDQATDH
jgi:hypothetical protein